MIQALEKTIRELGLSLGFAQVGFIAPHLPEAIQRYKEWLKLGYAGDMDWMHSPLRADLKSLFPEVQSFIMVRMNYHPGAYPMMRILRSPSHAAISRYALGRDYHKVMRNRLKKFSEEITKIIPHEYRVFTDSAPLLEKPLAQAAGLGWVGKNTLLIDPADGSYFFIGSIATTIPFTTDIAPIEDKCGKCHACMRICPTQAIVAPNVLDARLCISYLTIEHKGSIPVELRRLMGNRIYGCDDCQIICPFNKVPTLSKESDFTPRHALDNCTLLNLWKWDETQFLEKTEGTPIRRIGYERWCRNIAVALGNGPASLEVIEALEQKAFISELVQEHITWAIGELTSRKLHDSAPIPRWILRYHP